MYIHYKHIKEFNITQMPMVQKVNNFSLWLAAFACLGMSMVANFQYVNSAIPHLIGAFMVFGLGILYCWLQSYISHKMRSLGMSSTLTTVTRSILSLLATIFFLITSIAGPISMSQRADSKSGGNSSTVQPPTSASHWNESLKGYDNHLASTFCEWLMAISFLLFFLTYFREFQKISVSIKVSPKESEVFYPTEDTSQVM
ncbi:DNA damage-regulated autophagy modulator protein 1 [Exaiptasia diaphana]|nr:DNA damage-regulated autophagy modulator protein 1 [Exaiptasia diaphana]